MRSLLFGFVAAGLLLLSDQSIAREWTDATGGSGKVNVWDVATNSRVHVQATGNGYIQTLAVSDDGGFLAVPGSSARNMHVFEFER